MRIGVVPENLFERVAIAAGLLPTPLAESWLAFLMARAIMVGTKLGVFESLASGPLGPADVAARCGTHPGATAKLLSALVGCGYLSSDGSRYALTATVRKWLLEDSPQSCRDRILFQFLEWEWCQYSEEYVRTGRPMDLHAGMSEEVWGLYQRGMRSAIEPMAKELVGRLELPKGATRMIDIGGSHGYYSVAFCRRYPALSSTILELPEAIRHAAPILAREGMGDRVMYRAGNALGEDFGAERYDFAFLSMLAHHFDDATNRDLMKRVARSLKPGGVVAVFDLLRLGTSDRVGQLGSLLDLFFAMTSQSATWLPSEIADWQRDAGLKPCKVLRLRTIRELGAQAAVKPES